MSEPDVEDIEGAITVKEVASWFPEPIPTDRDPQLIKDLTHTIELTRQWLEATENSGDAELTQASRQLPVVSKAAKTLKAEITLLLKVGGSYVDTNPRIRALLNEVDLFLAEAPGRQEGKPPKQWNEAAYRWAPMIAECLKVEPKKPPSIVDKSGPVCEILAKAIKRVFRREYDTGTISKAIERRRSKQKKAKK